MNEKGKVYELKDIDIADSIADEILTIKEDNLNKYFPLVLVFLLCLLFLILSLGYAVLTTYHNGLSEKIEVVTEIIVDTSQNT